MAQLSLTVTLIPESYIKPYYGVRGLLIYTVKGRNYMRWDCELPKVCVGKSLVNSLHVRIFKILNGKLKREKVHQKSHTAMHKG